MKHFFEDFILTIEFGHLLENILEKKSMVGNCLDRIGKGVNRSRSGESLKLYLLKSIR